MDKIYVTRTMVSGFISNPDNYRADKPEGAILRHAYSRGIRLRHVAGGWVEYCNKSSKWKVYKVCTGW
ncbi:hypothetical protein [Vibrio vulnificus]|uniref:hypothetical protein n=1 Tax=Vibrio vulnificus TaxID=672 RepID=UPI00307E20CC|nr:hypothetical protein [Vibrio vulnificus]